MSEIKRAGETEKDGSAYTIPELEGVVPAEDGSQYASNEADSQDGLSVYAPRPNENTVQRAYTGNVYERKYYFDESSGGGVGGGVGGGGGGTGSPPDDWPEGEPWPPVYPPGDAWPPGWIPPSGGGGGGEPTVCVGDQYYSCGPTNDPYWANVVLMLHFESGMADTSLSAMIFTKEGAGSNGPTAGGKWGTGEYAIVDNVAYHNTTGFGSAFTIENDFTVECWVKYSGGTREGVGNFAGAYSSAAFQLALSSAYLLTGNFIIAGTSYNGTVSTAINDGLWHHYAVVRSGSNLLRFLDGKLENTVNCGTGSSATPTNFYVGRNAPTDYVFLDIDDLRITKGIARYTGNFNIPTAAFPDALETPASGIIERIATIASVATGNEIAIPAHLPGDMIILAARSASATIPTLPAGWTNIASSSPAYSNGIRLFYFIDPDGSVTSLTAPNASVFLGAIYRNAIGIGAASIEAMQGPATIATIGGATFSADYGQSRAFVGVSWNQGSTTGSTPSDHTLLGRTTGLGGGEFAAYDITPPTLTYAGGTSTGLTNGYGVPWTVEIKAGEILPFGPRTVLSLHAEDATDSSCYQPKTVTLTGSAAVSATEKKFGTSSFSVDNVGTSTLNGVVINDHMDFDFGTGDFTIEMWAYRNANTYNGTLFFFSPGGNFSLVVAATTGLVTLNYRSSGGTQADIATGVTFPLTAWQHVVVQRRRTNFEFFLHGVLSNTTAINDGASSTVNLSGNFYLGRTDAASAVTWNGYIDEVRITKGVARYGSIAAPSELEAVDDPYYANVDLLIRGNTVATDESTNAFAATAAGSAQISTTVKKYGAGALQGDGNGDWFEYPYNISWATGSTFTIEFWVRFNTFAKQHVLFSTDAANPYWMLVPIGGASITAALPGAASFNFSFSVDTWHHIALVVFPTGRFLYVDGGFVGANASSNVGTTPTVIRVLGPTAGVSTASSALDGYIDDFRITNGIARYPSSFDPATLPNCDSTSGGGGGGPTEPVPPPAPPAPSVDYVTPMSFRLSSSGSTLVFQERALFKMNGQVDLIGSYGVGTTTRTWFSSTSGANATTALEYRVTSGSIYSGEVGPTAWAPFSGDFLLSAPTPGSAFGVTSIAVWEVREVADPGTVYVFTVTGFSFG